jgi:hypothetical protein
MMSIIVLVTAISLTAGTALSADKPAHWPKTISIGSGTGTTYYAIAGGIGKLMDNYLGVAGIPSKTSGGTETARLMAKNEIQMGFLTPDIAYEASMGKMRFKDSPPAPIRVFLQDFPLTYNLITLKGSGIKSWPDIKGKKGYYRARGSGVMEVIWNTALDIYGLKKSDFKKVMPFDRASEWISALKTGKVDFAVDMGFHPAGKWMELANSHPMNIIGVDKADLAKFKKALPYVFPQTIPKGTYKTMPEEVLLPSIAIVIDVVRDLPDDLVYRLTKMIWTHNDEFKTYSRVCKFFTKEAVNRTNFIYHAGAIKYYKEAGTWTEKESKRQKRLLSEIGAAK